MVGISTGNLGAAAFPAHMDKLPIIVATSAGAPANKDKLDVQLYYLHPPQLGTSINLPIIL